MRLKRFVGALMAVAMLAGLGGFGYGGEANGVPGTLPTAPSDAAALPFPDTLTDAAALPSSDSFTDAVALPPPDAFTADAAALPASATASLLPLLSITTDSGELPGDADAGGTLRVIVTGAEGERAVTLQTPIEINLRGNTSRRFPKKSYRVKLVDEGGNGRKLSLAGLREDDDWILNPMYSDTSKLREALSYWLWDQINSQGRAAQSSRLAFVEVELNGEYWGLYGLQERVDRKQVGADRETGILYKVAANDRPTPEELLALEGAGACRGLELTFAGSGVEAPWAPAADYMALLEGREGSGGARLSAENTVDYALWAALVQARDGHFKNQFIHCRRTGEGYVLYRIPWDLNHALGDLWSGDSPGTNFLTYEITHPALDDVAALEIEADGGALFSALRRRWAELRGGTITEQRLLKQARELFERLYPAILRDGDRWPGSGMGEGNAANIRDIEDYFHITLLRMDGWLGGPGGEYAKTEESGDGENLDCGG